MNAFGKTRRTGFSLIELLIGVIIVGILAALAMPSLQQMLRNSEVRNAAETITSGLQRARAEAVARNTNIKFVLGVDGTWLVDYVIKPNPAAPPLDSQSGEEGSPNVTLVALANDLATPANTVTFNNLGQVQDPGTAIAQVDLSAPGATQSLRVTLGVGGGARMCDPSLAPGSSPRAC